jgi:hypothetical protein
VQKKAEVICYDDEEVQQFGCGKKERLAASAVVKLGHPSGWLSERCRMQCAPACEDAGTGRRLCAIGKLQY